MDFLPMRLLPDADLRRTLEVTLGERRYDAAYVIGGIGSLRQARLRYAGKNDAELLDGDLEILTLSGTLSPDGAHLHISVADANGRVIGGHVGYDCIVRTTAEVLLVPLPQWTFAREMDPGTGFPELVVRHKP